MDGNGRWAKKRGLPRIEGHRAGIKSVREVAEGCREIGVKALTLYAFSVENWKRPRKEVDPLMTLLHKFLIKEIEEMKSNGIKFDVWGRVWEMPDKIQKAINMAKEATSDQTKMQLTLALNYGGQTEIVDATRAIATKVAKGEIDPDKIDKDTIREHLYSAGVPDPDLLIRTSGELRVSNFLLWQIAYTEIVITETLWPEFRKEHLVRAIKEFQMRERRFGGIG
jgi:undecaprenyl diphosphate synthase